MTPGSVLPRMDAVPHPARQLLHSPVRPAAAALIRRRWQVRLHGEEQVPTSGPVVVAANHLGFIDGPLMAILSPRPVHALTKHEMFVGRTGAFLRRSGQIPVDRFHPDPLAVKTALRVLREGNVVGLFPEGARGAGDLARFHRGAAYLALAAGAPVVPLIFFGTREPGAHTNSVPPKGAAIDLVYGPPVAVEAVPWPRRREQVDRVSSLLRERLLAHLDTARALTGRSLPGPLPPTDTEIDPATGITDEEAS